MKPNLLTWLALVLLTAVSFLTSETAPSHAAALFILAAAGAKCAALSWQFMELRAAHWLWRGTLLALLAAVLGAVAAMQ